MITKISHVGIAVSNLASAQALFESLFGSAPEHAERVEDQKVDVSSFRVGDAHVELTAGVDPTSPVSRFIEKRGEGIHHIAFETDDIVAEMDRLKAAGVQFIDQQPRMGAGRCLIAFIHPKSANGVLVELSQKM